MKIAKFRIRHALTLTAVCAAALALLVATGFFGPNVDDMNIRIHSTLEQQANFVNQSGTIDDLASEIRKHFAFDVRIGFDGIDRDVRVGANSLSDIKLKNSLRIALKECDASYRIRNGKIWIVPFDAEWSAQDYNGPPLVHRGNRHRYEPSAK